MGRVLPPRYITNRGSGLKLPISEVGFYLSQGKQLRTHAFVSLGEGLPLAISGHALLAGTIELSDAIGPGTLLIEAGSLNADGLLSADPESYSFVVDGNTLRRDGDPEAGTPTPGPSGCACDQTAAPSSLATLILLGCFLLRREERRSLHPAGTSR